MTNQVTHQRRPLWTTFRANALTGQNRAVTAVSDEVTIITLDNGWEPPAANYDLVGLWYKGRCEHQAATSGEEVEVIERGYYHYDKWQPKEYRTGRIGAVYVAMFGRRSIEIMPERDLMIARICNSLGCTRQELEDL